MMGGHIAQSDTEQIAVEEKGRPEKQMAKGHFRGKEERCHAVWGRLKTETSGKE